MAKIKSAKKQIRVQARKRVYNLKRLDAFREARKEVKKLLEKKTVKAEEVNTAVGIFYKQVDKAAKHNTVHPNAAARYKSRLTALVNTKLGIG
jgi:small subunit ribosomal protein S20